MKELLHELTNTEFPRVANFFNEEIPNYPVAISVFEGNNPGRIWVDDVQNPSLCLLVTGGGYSFIRAKQIDKISESLFSAIVDILKENNPKVICHKEDPISLRLQHLGFFPRERIQLHHNEDSKLLDDICNSLPPNCEIKPIDAELLKKSNWLNYIKLFFGNEENFLKKGFGFALTMDSKIISEAFSCYIGGHCVEIGSVTTEAYRGQGYATKIKAFLVRESFRRGLRPISSTDVSNIASSTASKKIGFKEEMPYQFLVLHKP